MYQSDRRTGVVAECASISPSLISCIPPPPHTMSSKLFPLLSISHLSIHLNCKVVKNKEKGTRRGGGEGGGGVGQHVGEGEEGADERNSFREN